MPAQGSYRLTVKKGPVPGKEYEIAKEDATLGRDVGNDIVVNDSEVSRRHVQFTLQADGYLIEDLGSTNGTFINGQRLNRPALLRPGDTLGLGETVTLELSFVADSQATMLAGHGAAAPRPTPTPATAPTPAPTMALESEEPAAKPGNRLRWIGIGCGCLTLLACAIGIPLGIFLWNAPASFWRSFGF